MNFAVETDVGDRKREHGDLNEDAAAVVPVILEKRNRQSELEVLALADGAGGHDGGDIAAETAVATVTGELVSELTAIRADETDRPFGGLDADSIEAAIEAAIETADEEVTAVSEELVDNAATTIVAGVRLHDRFHYGWVGDSRAYVVNDALNQLTQLTEDHTSSAEDDEFPSEPEVLDRIAPNGHIVGQALGGSQYGEPVTVDTGSVDLYAEDTLLVTSDGLIDAHAHKNEQLRREYRDLAERDSEEALDTVRRQLATDEEIKRTVLDGDDLSTAASGLVDLANRYGGKDNVSIVLLADRELPETPTNLQPRGVNDDRGRDPIEQEPTRIEPDPSEPVGPADDAARGTPPDHGDGAVDGSPSKGKKPSRAGSGDAGAEVYDTEDSTGRAGPEADLRPPTEGQRASQTDGTAGSASADKNIGKNTLTAVQDGTVTRDGHTSREGAGDRETDSSDSGSGGLLSRLLPFL
jgi:serine/threonine protein phosphatase PrpC